LAKSVQNDAYVALIEALKRARESAGLTQHDVAKRLKRPQSFVSKYEKRERRLDVIEFVQVAGALEINPAPLIKKLAGQVARA
jgi:transcriptional regulator with XRE-family HTH domain